jgi:hypothetical protein
MGIVDHTSPLATSSRQPSTDVLDEYAKKYAAKVDEDSLRLSLHWAKRDTEDGAPESFAAHSFFVDRSDEGYSPFCRRVGASCDSLRTTSDYAKSYHSFR